MHSNYVAIYDDKEYEGKGFGYNMGRKEQRMGSNKKKRNKQDVESIIVWMLFIDMIVYLALVIYILYKLPSPDDKPKAGDILGFEGSILCMLPSIIIAIFGLIQTARANKISEDAYSIGRYQYNLQLRPFVMITSVHFQHTNSYKILENNGKTRFQIEKPDCVDVSKIENPGILWISFVNTTDSYMTIQYVGGFSKKRRCWYRTSVNQVYWSSVVKPNEQMEIGFYASEKFWENNDHRTVTLKLKLTNRFGTQYIENVSLKVLHSMYASAADDDPYKNHEIPFEAFGYKVSKVKNKRYGKHNMQSSKRKE